MKISDLVSQSFTSYGKVFKLIVPLVLLAALVKDAYLYLGGLPENHTIRLVVILVMVLLQVYLWSAALYGANAILKSEPLPLNAICKATYQKLSLIYMGTFLLLLGGCIIFFIGYLLTTLVASFFPEQAVRAAAALIFIGVPLIIGLMLFFFALPLLILESISVWPAFRESARLVGYKNWAYAFIPYAAIMLLFLITLPATGHGRWLQAHHLNFVFDAIVLMLLSPIVINFILLALKGLRLRQSTT